MIEVVHETVSSNGKEIVLEKGRRAPGVRLIIETSDGEFLITKEERFDVDFIIMTAELSEFINELLAAFGGENSA